MDTLNPWLPLPDDWQSQPDEKLGWWLVAAWIGFQADKAGIPRGSIPHGWTEGLIRESANMDSDSVENASLESAFRKACNGDMATAGRMLRGIVEAGGYSQAVERLARTGAKVRRPFAAHNGKRSRNAANNANAWQAEAAKLWALPQHARKNASDIARLIDSKRWNTIRRHLRRPTK